MLVLAVFQCDLYKSEFVLSAIDDQECVSNRWENAQQISKTPLRSHGKLKLHLQQQLRLVIDRSTQ